MSDDSKREESFANVCAKLIVFACVLGLAVRLFAWIAFG